MMYDREKSDFAIVAGKPTNKAGATAAEPVEPRAGTKRNTDEQSTHRTLSRERVSQALRRVRKLMPSDTQGRSRMRETRSYGSVRGAAGNSRPYREPGPSPDSRAAASVPARCRRRRRWARRRQRALVAIR